MKMLRPFPPQFGPLALWKLGIRCKSFVVSGGWLRYRCARNFKRLALEHGNRESNRDFRREGANSTSFGTHTMRSTLEPPARGSSARSKTRELWNRKSCFVASSKTQKVSKLAASARTHSARALWLEIVPPLGRQCGIPLRHPRRRFWSPPPWMKSSPTSSSPPG